MFPDYSLPDHTGTVRTLSELQGRDPLILLLARGNYCPKHRRLDEALEAGMRIVSLFWGDPAGWTRPRPMRCEGRVQTPQPASLTVATSLGGAARVEEAWSHSVRSPPSRAFHQGRRGTVILTAPPRRSPALSEALRDRSVRRCSGPPLLVPRG